MKLRTLEEIQTDIRTVSQTPENFFSWLRNSKEDRLRELRKEEFARLDKWLIESNEEYQQLSADSLESFHGLSWKMTVLQKTDFAKNGSNVIGLKGSMDTDAELRCFTHSKFWEGNPINPTRFIGSMDHFGNFLMEAVAQKYDVYERALPSFYTAYVGEKGRILMEKEAKKNQLIFVGYEISILTGTVFMEEVARKRFQDNKKRLTMLIDSQRLKADPGKFFLSPRKLY